MENNNLLMIVLAFVLGYMVSGMMKQMCGPRLVEGSGSGTAHKFKGSTSPYDAPAPNNLFTQYIADPFYKFAGPR